MGTNTPNLQLFKPDPDDDNVNVQLDINDNYDKIDLAVQDALDGTTSTALIERTSNNPSGVTAETIADTLTFAAVNGQRYKIVWDGAFFSTVANDLVRATIRDTNISGTQMQIRNISPTIASQAFPVHVEFFWTASVTANKTFVTTVQRVSGTGLITGGAGATSPTSFYAERANV